MFMTYNKIIYSIDFYKKYDNRIKWSKFRILIRFDMFNIMGV